MSRVADKISIGISLTLDKTGTVREGRATQYIDELYIRSLQDVGGLVRLIPTGSLDEELLDGLDGRAAPEPLSFRGVAPQGSSGGRWMHNWLRPKRGELPSGGT